GGRHAKEGAAREPRAPHCAVRPRGWPAVPQDRSPGLARTAVDASLLARLEAAGMTFSPAADRFTLARRAHLDLLGLPPTPEEVDAFLADARPDAYERLLDPLPAAPRLGARGGRHRLGRAPHTDP